MKTIFKIIPILLLASCATRPPVWKDEYGIVHRESVAPDEITYIKVIGANNLPGGCIRLRNIYLKGRMFKDYELKEATAKMSGTHVVKQYYNGISDIMGVAFDCSQRRAIVRQDTWLKLRRRNMAIGELERRSYEKVKIAPKTSDIPTLKYNEYK